MAWMLNSEALRFFLSIDTDYDNKHKSTYDHITYLQGRLTKSILPLFKSKQHANKFNEQVLSKYTIGDNTRTITQYMDDGFDDFPLSTTVCVMFRLKNKQRQIRNYPVQTSKVIHDNNDLNNMTLLHNIGLLNVDDFYITDDLLSVRGILCTANMSQCTNTDYEKTAVNTLNRTFTMSNI
jgi:hypothetical protein